MSQSPRSGWRAHLAASHRVLEATGQRCLAGWLAGVRDRRFWGTLCARAVPNSAAPPARPAHWYVTGRRQPARGTTRTELTVCGRPPLVSGGRCRTATRPAGRPAKPEDSARPFASERSRLPTLAVHMAVGARLLTAAWRSFHEQLQRLGAVVAEGAPEVLPKQFTVVLLPRALTAQALPVPPLSPLSLSLTRPATPASRVPSAAMAVITRVILVLVDKSQTSLIGTYLGRERLITSLALRHVAVRAVGPHVEGPSPALRRVAGVGRVQLLGLGRVRPVHPVPVRSKALSGFWIK